MLSVTKESDGLSASYLNIDLVVVKTEPPENQGWSGGGNSKGGGTTQKAEIGGGLRSSPGKRYSLIDRYM